MRFLVLFLVTTNIYAQTLRPWQKDVPVGSIVEVDGACPDGWLSANSGLAVSRTTYKNLFDKIGVKYGSGDGSTTFNLPSFIKCTSDLDCTNTFTANGSGQGVVSSESLDFISSASSPSTGQTTAVFQSGLFTVVPSVVFIISGSGAGACDDSQAIARSTTEFTGLTGAGGYGTVTSCPWSVTVTKQGVDFKPASKKPSLLDQCIKF